MSNNKSARVTVLLPESLARIAHAKAALEGRKLPEVIREWLEEYVENGLPGYQKRSSEHQKEPH